jgi:hypothetical protein
LRIAAPREVRQRRTGIGADEIGWQPSDGARPPVSSAFAAGEFDADQRCGRRKQYSARKAGGPATPHMRIGAAGPNLLCMVQMQNCLRFAQLMISF